MNWHDPSDRSQPIISPQAEIEGYLRKHGADPAFRLNPCFLLSTTGRDDVKSLQNTFSVREESFLLPAFLGKRPIYTIDGDPAVSLVQRVCAAPVAVDTLEVAIVLGARSIFLFGVCGGISDNVKVGDIIIPSEIKREEGTSYHYAPADQNARPDDKILESFLAFLSRQSNIRVHTGKTVTTDAVYRQTLNKELTWRDEGILGVEMEMSALLTVAEFYGLPAVCMLVVSDKHKLEPGSTWHWGGKDLVESQARAINLFVDFIGSFTSEHDG